MVMLVVTACGEFSDTVKDRELRKTTRNQIIDVIEEFGAPEYQDLVFEDIDHISGEARLYTEEEGDSIGLIVYDGKIACYITIYLSESSRTELLIWEIDISYIDYANEIYIDLEFYHYDEGIFTPDYKDEILAVNYIDFARGVELLTIEDIRYILNEVGYKEVNQNG